MKRLPPLAALLAALFAALGASADDRFMLWTAYWPVAFHVLYEVGETTK